ncbi:CyP450 monooxygenase [Amylostereum chailletii]|nr:CyP450 monooxygenase [Amylostereum chailletii]
MTMGPESLAVCAFALCITFLCNAYLRRRRTIAATPPGPPPLPLLENILDIPTRTPWRKYAEWGRVYGSDVISVRSFGQLTVVVNSENAARELFEKRSFNYSDRPHFTILDLMGWSFNVAYMPYAERWRTCRRMMHHFLHEKASLVYRPLAVNKASDLLKNLQRNPAHFREHIAQYAASIVMSVAYAYDVEPENDRYVPIAEKALEMLSDSVFPGAAIVNSFPILKYLPSWFPGAGFQTFAKECRTYTTKMREGPMEYVKAGMASGTARPSMASSLIEANEMRNGGPDEMDIVKDVTAMVYAAGSDTTFSTITSFFLAMAVHPAAQRRAQAEIDAVVGRDRLPTFEDRASLPFADAIYREVLRWNPSTPLGVHRQSLQDDEYEGHFIPGGTMLLYNTWAILHNPDVYPDPENFKPERFLNVDGTLNADEVTAAFGFGRRICIGMHLARSSVWLAIVYTLAMFNIENAKDDEGLDIPVEVNYSDGVLSHAAPFKCSITPRDAKAASLIREPEVLI